MAISNIACHPRVAQLRVYQDLPVNLEESHPQKCIYPTSAPVLKTTRSSTKRAASTVDRDQPATGVGVKGVGKGLKLASSNHRVPFRSIQNNCTPRRDPVNFEPPLKIIDTGKCARGRVKELPEQVPYPHPYQIAPPRANLKKRPRVLPSTPTPIYQGARDATRSNRGSPPRFPSRFVLKENSNGYAALPALRLSRAETDHPNLSDMISRPPSPATRTASPSRSTSISTKGACNARDGYTFEEDRSAELAGRVLENEMAIEECDISEVDLSDFN